jgi:penicillin amidase
MKGRKGQRLLALMIGASLFGPLAAQVALADAPADETIAVAGLSQPSDILIDRWGVPHIYAANDSDAFFVQGFNAARDRMFQIDLWRRRGLGELSEVFGPAYVEQDKATRLFLYRGDMATEWQRYGPDAKPAATRFAAGVNAYIDWLAAHPDRMPYEFRKIGYWPAKWNADDIVRIRSHGLTRNLTSEVARARVACKSSLDADALRFGLQPQWKAQMPAGLDPCLPDDVLKVHARHARRARDEGVDEKRGCIDDIDRRRRQSRGSHRRQQQLGDRTIEVGNGARDHGERSASRVRGAESSVHPADQHADARYHRCGRTFRAGHFDRA